MDNLGALKRHLTTLSELALDDLDSQQPDYNNITAAIRDEYKRRSKRRLYTGARLMEFYETLKNCNEESHPDDIEDCQSWLDCTFNDSHLYIVQERFEQNGRPDWPARCLAFNTWTDNLVRRGVISQWLANNCDHPASTGGQDL